MQVEYSAVVRTARDNLVAHGMAVPLGHVYELTAAFLGYKSRSAYQASSEEPQTFSNTDYIVLDLPLAESRASSLGYSAVEFETITGAVRKALRHVLLESAVYLNSADLLDDFHERFSTAVYEDGEVAREAANTNAYLDEVEAEWLPDVDVAAATDEWVVPVFATVHMDQDPERPFFGDTIHVNGTITFDKVGRRCLAAARVDILDAALDYDW